MIIITGPGRCGTSMVMEVAHGWELNCDIGHRLARLDAGWESASSIQIAQSFIKHYHLKLSLAHVGYHADKMKDIKFEVLKDPSFVTYAPIITHWWNVRKDIEIIYLTRDFEQIAASQKRHPEMTCPTYRCFPEQIAIKQNEFLGELIRFKIPHTIIEYPFVKFNQVYEIFKKHFPNKTLEHEECLKTWDKIVRL